MTDGSDGMVTRVLELASQKRIADALSMVNERVTSGETSADVESLRLLLGGADAMENGQYEQGLRDVLPALRLLEKNEDHISLLGWVYSVVGFALGVLGNPKGGLDWVGRAIVGAEGSGDTSQLCRFLRDEASLFAMLGEDDRSIASLEKALELRGPAFSSYEQAELLNELSRVNLNSARNTEQDDERKNDLAQKALVHANAAMDLLKDAGDEHLKAQALENMGSALNVLGKFREAEEAFKEALSLANDESGTVETLTRYAQLLVETDRYDEADATLSRAYDKALKENVEASLDRIFLTRVRLEMLAGKTNDALRWMEGRFHALEERYKKQIASAVRCAGLFAELEYGTKAGDDELTALPENIQQSRYWQDESLKDPLTHCFNRRGLTVLSGPFFASQNKTALALVDLDHFKSVNDTFGHETGDKVIQVIAEIIKKCFRDTDLVTRYGGEEFLVLLKGIESNVAWGVCERLRLAIEHFGWGKIADGLHVTASIGLSVRTNDDYLDALTEKADASLHRAKDDGRNKVVLLQ